MLEEIRADVGVIGIVPRCLRFEYLLGDRSADEILKPLNCADLLEFDKPRILRRLNKLLIDELSVEILVIQVPMRVKCVNR